MHFEFKITVLLLYQSNITRYDSNQFLLLVIFLWFCRTCYLNVCSVRKIMCRAIDCIALDSELNLNVTLILAINWYIFLWFLQKNTVNHAMSILNTFFSLKLIKRLLKWNKSRDWIWEWIKIYFQANVSVEYKLKILYILKHFKLEYLNIIWVGVDSITQRFTTFFSSDTQQGTYYIYG